jgi:hypothetical protein
MAIFPRRLAWHVVFSICQKPHFASNESPLHIADLGEPIMVQPPRMREWKTPGFRGEEQLERFDEVPAQTVKTGSRSGGYLSYLLVMIRPAAE